MSTKSAGTSQAIGEWTRLFPKQITETYTSSVTFMKQLTTIAISTMTYMRHLFPEDCYIPEKFAGLTVRSLKKKCKNEDAQFVSSALTQAFDAFDKKYLHQLLVLFYDGDNTKQENLVEYWIFEYTYNGNAVTMNVSAKNKHNNKIKTSQHTFNDIRNQTTQLMRTVFVMMETRQFPLPDECNISFRLYYNEDAPEGYQAPGYMATLEEEDHVEPLLSKAMNIGSVETPFHIISAGSYVKEDLNSNQVNPSRTPPMLTQIESNFDSYSNSSDLRIFCPCKVQDFGDESPRALLTCYYCNTKQHAACFGIGRENVGSVLRHCCTVCYQADPTRTPTDDTLNILEDSTKKEALCLFRCVIEWCREKSSVSVEDVMLKYPLSKNTIFKILKKFHHEGVIEEAPVESIVTSYNIDHNKLAILMSKHFHNEDKDIIDQLLSESLSQQSQLDPVRDVLGDKEIEDLHNTSNMGKIVQPVHENIEVDAALKEYRDAIMSSDKGVELPLSGNKEKDVVFRKRKANVASVRSKTKKIRKSSD